MTTEARCFIRSPLIVEEDKSDPIVQCCCNCKYHFAVHYHCTTEPKPPANPLWGKCVCPVQKGWACGSPDHLPRIYDNWPEHSIGCETYTPVKPHEEVGR